MQEKNIVECCVGNDAVWVICKSREEIKRIYPLVFGCKYPDHLSLTNSFYVSRGTEYFYNFVDLYNKEKDNFIISQK